MHCIVPVRDASNSFRGSHQIRQDVQRAFELECLKAEGEALVKVLEISNFVRAKHASSGQTIIDHGEFPLPLSLISAAVRSSILVDLRDMAVTGSLIVCQHRTTHCSLVHLLMPCSYTVFPHVCESMLRRHTQRTFTPRN